MAGIIGQRSSFDFLECLVVCRSKCIRHSPADAKSDELNLPEVLCLYIMYKL